MKPTKENQIRRNLWKRIKYDESYERELNTEKPTKENQIQRNLQKRINRKKATKENLKQHVTGCKILLPENIYSEGEENLKLGTGKIKGEKNRLSTLS